LPAEEQRGEVAKQEIATVRVWALCLVIVARTQGYTYTVRVWALCLVIVARNPGIHVHR
jgi:hypothetical protein